ncbi:BTAD domain-containing putative transcriptional regulator [Nocardioides sp. YIM 152588]|uniref:BTAD domain-containing putative transcriptional regulator n=1 Tax=Nocardioides sp. YIM 152588 TaxID=3158259 RepID=UPI0032E3BA21
MALTLVVAAAGYGKSTWVESALGTDGARLPAAEVTPAALADLVDRGVPGIAVEDLQQATPEQRLAVLRTVGLSRPDVYLTSRRPLTVEEAAALTVTAWERGPADLRLTPDQVATVLEAEYAIADPELPTLVHHATTGWPMLVHLFARAISRATGPRWNGTVRQATEFARWVAQVEPAVARWCERSVLGALAPEAREVLTALASLEVVTDDLVATLWDAPAVTDLVGELRETGVLAPHPRCEIVDRLGWRVVPALAAVLPRATAPQDRDRARAAAAWFEAHDHPMAGVRTWLAAGEPGRARRLLETASDRVIDQGDASDVLALLSPDLGAPALAPGDATRLLLGRALRLTGRLDEALSVLRPLVEASPDRWDLGLAMTMASIHESRGELARADEALDRVDAGTLPDRGPGQRWRVLKVRMLAGLGEPAAARQVASEALRLAEASGDPGDLCQAHQAAARADTGQTREAHLAQAAHYARLARDAATMPAILSNQVFSLLGAADYVRAARVGHEAVRVSELVRPIGSLVVALHNLAEALTRLGEFDEARWRLRHAEQIGRRLGGARAAASLSGLGDLCRAVGQREQGHRAYVEAIQLAAGSGEVQVLVPAQAGLARLLASEDPVVARKLADDALGQATPGLAPYALAALAWVELATGDREAAVATAARAAAASRDAHALDLLAESLEVLGAAEPAPAAARTAYREALSIWRTGGAEPDASRLEVRLARLEGADRETRARGREAGRRLRRLGLLTIGGEPAGEDPVEAAVRVRVLGGFEVVVGGEPISTRSWKSRQARTLVKLLAAHRGRPVSRDRLCQVLWPDDDPVKTSHRLSVLLTTVRGVLDPARAWPADHYLASDNRGVWLDLRRVGLDVEDLITEADWGAERLAVGDEAGAREALTAAERLHRGEAFEDEPDEEWAIAIREECRQAWVRTLRHLATLALSAGHRNDAVAYLQRCLAVDPYDERVHRGLVRTLVRSGRHGEARRAFDAWERAMAEIDAPPPDPALLAPRRT